MDHPTPPSADACTCGQRHHIRPAHSPAGHPRQRYFSESGLGGIYGFESATSVSVMRFDRDDTALLFIGQIGVGEIKIRLTPSGLRRLASDLLDAAADIEANPAAALFLQQLQQDLTTATAKAGL